MHAIYEDKDTWRKDTWRKVPSSSHVTHVSSSSYDMTCLIGHFRHQYEASLCDTNVRGETLHTIDGEIERTRWRRDTADHFIAFKHK